jgi:hypothetical protein
VPGSETAGTCEEDEHVDGRTKSCRSKTLKSLALE